MNFNRRTLDQNIDMARQLRITIKELQIDGWTVRLQLIRCGKPNCKCVPRPCHGPYWYGFKHNGSGRTRSKYIGKDLKRFRPDSR